MIRNNFVRGDNLGLDIPIDGQTLISAGEPFLTSAFRASGAIDHDDSVSGITAFKDFVGGSTGQKMLLSVAYGSSSRELHNELFVKFSRDTGDSLRDAGKVQMEREVLFSLISRDPAFPIAVPACYFSDYHAESGTGILITERIFFGKGGIEPHYPKAQDHLMPDQLAHYQALFRALASLAGTHKSGYLADRINRYFPFSLDKLTVSERASPNADQIARRIQGLSEFTRHYPQLLPEHLRSQSFISRLAREAPRFLAAGNVKDILHSKPEMIALCHWNAHVDNAWFWRNDAGELECGLMDWGNVSQMNVAMAIWGCLSAAETDLWDNHLDSLLALFIEQFEKSGGPALDRDELKLHLIIYVASMGLTWLLGAPRLLRMQIPDLAMATDRLDPMIQGNELGRSQLLIMTIFLNLWEREDMNKVIEFMENFSLPLGQQR